MKIKTFALRLNSDHSQNDENALNKFLEKVNVKKTSTELLEAEGYWSVLVFYDNDAEAENAKVSIKLSVTSEDELTNAEKMVYETMRKWRQDKANQLDIPNYLVCHNTELMSIARLQPRNLDELSKIKGFGGQKISKYGEEILMVLQSA